jgi:hypothetical protein
MASVLKLDRPAEEEAIDTYLSSKFFHKPILSKVVGKKYSIPSA